MTACTGQELCLFDDTTTRFGFFTVDADVRGSQRMKCDDGLTSSLGVAGIIAYADFLYSLLPNFPYITFILVPFGQAFFTITLISSEKVANLKPMPEDVAEQQSGNVMESRDSILAYFRKNHLEFTTLRHAQYATLCMLVELQSQSM